MKSIRNFVLGAAVSLLSLSPVSAEVLVIPGTNNSVSVHFESATIIGHGLNINMLRVPVIIDGEELLFDMVFRFTYTNDEGLVFEKISEFPHSSPPLHFANLITGTYHSNDCSFELTGPTSLNDGFSGYLLNGIDNEFAARIFTGGAPTELPEIKDRERAPLLTDDYLYGVISSFDRRFTNAPDDDPCGSLWLAGELIGLQQFGDDISIVLLSEGTNNNGDPEDFILPRQTHILERVVQ